MEMGCKCQDFGRGIQPTFPNSSKTPALEVELTVLIGEIGAVHGCQRIFIQQFDLADARFFAFWRFICPLCLVAGRLLGLLCMRRLFVVFRLVSVFW